MNQKTDINTPAAKTGEAAGEDAANEAAANEAAEAAKQTPGDKPGEKSGDTPPEEKKNTELPEQEEGGDADPEESQDDPESDPETPPVEIAFPEGSTFSPDQQADLVTKIRAAGDSQEAFDDLVKTVGDLGSSERAALDEAAQKAEESTLAGWAADLTKDPEFGPNHDGNQLLVKEFLATQSDEFNKVINDSLMIQNPEFVKTMLVLANQRKDADIITTGMGSSKQSVQRDAQGRRKFNFDKTLKKE